MLLVHNAGSDPLPKAIILNSPHGDQRHPSHQLLYSKLFQNPHKVLPGHMVHLRPCFETVAGNVFGKYAQKVDFIVVGSFVCIENL